MSNGGTAVKRLAVAAVATLLLLTACGGAKEETTQKAPEAAPPKGNITFWHFFTDREERAIQAVVKDFEAKYPDVKVTVKGGQDDEKMKQAISAGKGPDVGLSYSTDIVGAFCTSGAWRDLKTWIDRDKVDINKLLPVVRSYTEYNGKRCAMPMLADTYGLYYNKKLLAEAGYSAPPKTFSELEQMALKMTKKKADGSIDIAGFVPITPFYENTPSHYAPIFGAKWLKPDGTSNVGSDPAWNEMLTWQKGLLDKMGGYAVWQKFDAGKGEEFSADNSFQKGKIALHIDGEYRIAFVKDQSRNIDFGTAPMPVPDDKADRYGAGYITGNIMGISKGSQNPEAAWALIKYLTLDTDAIVKLANGIKNVPTTEEALKSPKLEVDEKFKTFIDILENKSSDTSPSTANGAVYQNTFQEFVNRWQQGKVPDLAAGLKRQDEVINKQLQLGQAP